MRQAGLLLVLALTAPPLQAQWQTIEPGGDTVCSDGSPYRFFVHSGDPSRLVVEFEGGGACWSAETCASDVYKRRVDIGPEEAQSQGLLQGIYDRENPQNPIREWTHVYVPYCSADIHWGLKDQTYQGLGGPFVIHHRGFANAGSALRWTVENVPAPRQVLVAGCSAGGYGSIMWAPRVLDAYPGAQVAQLADSAAGVVPQGFLGVLRANWGVEHIWPEHIPGVASSDVDPAQATLVDLYRGVAAYYPLASFSEFSRTADTTQLLFTLLAGGLLDPTAWEAALRASFDQLEAESPNFHSYLAPGSEHCIINQASFYTTEVDGVPFSEWLGRLLDSGDPGSVPAR